MVALALRALLVTSLASAEIRGFTQSTELATPLVSLHHHLRTKALALFGFNDGSDDGFGPWGDDPGSSPYAGYEPGDGAGWSSDESEQGDSYFEKQRKQEDKFRFTMITNVWTFIIMTVVAGFYVKYRLLPARGDVHYGSGSFNDWTNNWYDCSNTDWRLLFMGLCCWPARGAETSSMLGLGMPFWTGYAILSLLYFVGSVPIDSVAVLGSVMVAIFMARQRQKIRHAFNFREQGRDALCRDMLLYFCCTPCAIIQDAKLVEDAFAQGHEATQLPLGRQQEVMYEGYIHA